MSDNSGRKNGWGRGLDALLNASVEPVEVGRVGAQGDFVQIDIDQITPGTYQPRRHIKEAGLDELAASIKAQGVMQPIVVRKNKEGLYELIAGERRWRATGLAGLHSIPAVVREISDEQAAAMALIENLQREDLNPYEEAMALGRLRDQFGLTQQQIADAIGKSRTTVTNILRLLNLSSSVAALLEHGDIEMGHARALLALEPESQGITASKVKAKGLSVRKTEMLVKQILDGRTSGPDPIRAAALQNTPLAAEAPRGQRRSRSPARHEQRSLSLAPSGDGLRPRLVPRDEDIGVNDVDESV